MQIFYTYRLADGHLIKVGSARDSNELNNIFHFRYLQYLKHGYIEPHHDEADIDVYDNERTIQIIITFDDNIVGTARLIRENTLPTEKYYSFLEPAALKTIPKINRGEVSRVIANYPEGSEKYLFNHAILLFILLGLSKAATNDDIQAGYCFIKQHLFCTLKKFQIPITEISNAKITYSSSYLHNFFYGSKQNPVLPCFFFTDGIVRSLENIMSNFRKKINLH